MSLTAQMRKALKVLAYECDYEDSRTESRDNFILRSKLAPGIGDKTIAQLIELRYIITGPNKWFGETGYRITAAGRDAIK